MGLFDNIVSIGGKINNGISAANPYTAGVAEVLNLMPEGGMKDWLKLNALAFWNKILTVFTGRTYTSKQYTLGERYIDQVVPDGSPDAISDWRNVPDEIVAKAMVLFTILFGVRITTMDDLDALQAGKAAYKARPDKQDIPDIAIDRAVMLKQTYFPDSLYNKSKWNLTYFEQFPLKAPIPGVDPGTLYNGELPGGAQAVNGVIIGDGLLDQVIPGGPPTPPGTPGTPGAPGTPGTPVEDDTDITTIALIGGIGVLALWLFTRKKKAR